MPCTQSGPEVRKIERARLHAFERELYDAVTRKVHHCRVLRTMEKIHRQVNVVLTLDREGRA